MNGFGRWLLAKGSFYLSAGANSWLMTINHLHPHGSIAYLEQVKEANGADVPRFAFSVVNGIIQQSQLSPLLLQLPLDSTFFDTLRAEYISQFNLGYTLSPESIAAGATFADMTGATDADLANVTTVNQMRALLGISAL